MKKVMILVSAIVLTASAATAAYVCSQKSSGLFEANVEALAKIELGEYVRCYDTIKSDPTETVFYCGTCSDIPGRWKGGMNYCKVKK